MSKNKKDETAYHYIATGGVSESKTAKGFEDVGLQIELEKIAKKIDLKNVKKRIANKKYGTGSIKNVNMKVGDVAKFKLSKEQIKGRGISLKRVGEFIVDFPFSINGHNGSKITVTDNGELISGNTRTVAIRIGMAKKILDPNYKIPVVVVRSINLQETARLKLEGNHKVNNVGAKELTAVMTDIPYIAKVINPLYRAIVENPNYYMSNGKPVITSTVAAELSRQLGFLLNKTKNSYMLENIVAGRAATIIPVQLQSDKGEADDSNRKYSYNSGSLAHATTLVDLRPHRRVFSERFTPFLIILKALKESEDFVKFKSIFKHKVVLHFLVAFALNNVNVRKSYNFSTVTTSGKKGRLVVGRFLKGCRKSSVDIRNATRKWSSGIQDSSRTISDYFTSTCDKAGPSAKNYKNGRQVLTDDQLKLLVDHTIGQLKRKKRK